MSTETLPAIQTSEVTSAQATAWLGMAQQKNNITAALSGMELQAQSILLPVMDSGDYAAIDAALASYRKLNTDMKDKRIPFTNAVDTGIVQPLMAYEKRVKDAPEYATLVTRSLTLRKAEADKAELANKKNQEVARFKAHVDNEFSRVASEYRNMLRREITQEYELELKAGGPANTGKLKEMLKTFSVPATNKFNTALLTGEEMMRVYETLPKPDYASMYIEACKDLDEMFANFESDLANAEAAIKHNQEQTKLAEIEESKKLAEETAMTTLIATAETVTVETPRIKKSLTVIIVESEQWAKAVMAAFIVNLPHLGKFIRVKSWSKLTIGQMAVALGQLATETGVTFSNLNVQEVEK